jgi:transcriptional regulator with XRE-family HTH domain
MDPRMRAGTKLRAAREAKGLSLEQVAKETRIRVEYVAALETMNVNLIPGKAYAKAYLRSYVKFLGLTEDELVIQYENESARLREDDSDQIRNPDSKPAPERPWFWAAVLGVVCLAFVGWRALQDGQPDAPVRPAPKEEARVAPLPTPPPPAAAPDSEWPVEQVVAIRAKVPAWLEVRGPDGTIFVSRTLQAGEAYRPDVGANWTLHAKDGGAFEVLVNGTVVGLLGDIGAPVLGRPVDKIASAPPPAAPAGEG